MGTVIRSKIGAPVPRSNFERLMFRGIELGLEGWERSHSQGAGTGRESPHGILYAPKEVNQRLQNRGIEQFIRDFFLVKSPDVELYLITDTTAWPLTRRLRSIEYVLQAKRGAVTRTLFEASIEVSNDRKNPRVSVSAAPRGDFEEFLPTLPKKK